MMVVLPIVDCNLLPVVDVCSIDQYKGTKSVIGPRSGEGHPDTTVCNGTRTSLQCE